MNKMELKKRQKEIIYILEEGVPKQIQQKLLYELEYLEALGDHKKGMLTAEQKMLLFSYEDYLTRKRFQTDKEIYEEIGVSRRTFYLWKKSTGLISKGV
ncbi:hypothetical protein X560_1010 [Listeria fleischmannii 1991]|uniref:Uncharacterized protein n=2 Tax=Listeria fleischmannii TaxID=1069827 RepID=A0A2X3J6S7_9LIST|nr:hypothetical protein [Listeria fleischmannii]EMG28274.1 putative Antigen D [Listeria fleischmannii subsp. fleischmannii LU2006-1]KMT60084.1 hypothetical protein X560_1010 [Listeria fleischmannii 1991]SQC68749.1 Uncharacterised protein [Listeria fleischmannii subsp. fleischmannii]